MSRQTHTDSELSRTLHAVIAVLSVKDAPLRVAHKQLFAKMLRCFFFFLFYKHCLFGDCYLGKSDWKVLNIGSAPKKEWLKLMENL